MKISLRAVAASFVPFLLAASCKVAPPQPGEPCTDEGSSICTDATTRLHCVERRYVLERCAECVQKKTTAGFGSCSETSSFESFVGCSAGGVGPEGGACFGESADCTADGKTYVACTGGKYRYVACRGPKGCSHGADGTACDHGAVRAGDACVRDGYETCSADGAAWLKCVGGVLVLNATCGGPKGCTLAGEKLDCDHALANVGEPCVGGGACSKDARAELSCEGGRYAVRRLCRGPRAECVDDHGDARCAEPGLAEVGDPCDGTYGACADDGKAMLECKGGKFVVEDRCRTCTLAGAKATCAH